MSIQRLLPMESYADYEPAARQAGVTASEMYEAVRTGETLAGAVWRDVSLPVAFAPSTDSRLKPILRVSDGQRFKSITHAVRGFFMDAVPTSRQYRKEWMALKRAMGRGIPWHGETFRPMLARDLSPAPVISREET